MKVNDEVALKQLQSQEWFTYSSYIDPNKISANIPSFSYLLTEITNLEKYCTPKVMEHVLSKPNWFESKNSKTLCRSGVPPKYMRSFLLKWYNIKKINKDNYDNKFELTFKNHSPDNWDEFVPYYTSYKTLSESLPIHFLNDSGVTVLKEILWLINGLVGNLEFSPLIIKLCSIILLFCDKYETFEIMSQLIETNYILTETYKIRWHIRFTFNDNLKIVTSISESLQKLADEPMKELFDHLSKINFPIEWLFEDWCYSMFTDYLNFFGIIRLLPFFLEEGIKSVYRISYAILKTVKNDIWKISSPSDVVNIIRKNTKMISNITMLFESSYALGWTRYNNNYDFQENPPKDLFQGKRNNYYLPAIDPMSKILQDKCMIKLWDKLPIYFKIKDAKLIYDSSSDGYALSTLIGLSEKEEFETSIWFIIETSDGDVLGGFQSNMFKHTDGKFMRPTTSLWFTADLNESKVNIYSVQKESDEILYIDNSCLMFGNGSKGPAIRLDKDLNYGFSYEGGCFDNPILVKNEKGEFTVKKIEIYKVV